MEKYEKKIIEEMVCDREHVSFILRGLGNRQRELRRVNKQNKTCDLFIATLNFAEKVIWANEHNIRIPKVKRRDIKKYLELLDCLYSFSDQMYQNRKSAPLLMFLSHEDHVRALEIVTKEIRKYLDRI